MVSPRSPVQPLLGQALSSAKMLSADRERELLLAYHAEASKEAMDELVRTHMPLIFRVATRSAKNPGVDINDLVMTATEGLLIAINRWSFEKSDASGARFAAELKMENEENGKATGEIVLPRGSRLATYAMWWMRILLTDSVIENRGMVVRAKNAKIRKALFNLPAAIKTLDIRLPLTGSDVERLAAHLGIGVCEIEEALLHAAGDVMLDEPMGDGVTARGEGLADQLAESEESILSRLASTDRWNAICRAMMALSSRERFILITRYLLSRKWKLDRLSHTLKMSRERIRQIGNDSLAQIRKQVPSRDIGYNPRPCSAAAQLGALVELIEQLSTTTDERAIGLFLVEHGIKIGPTRVVGHRSKPAIPFGPQDARLNEAFASLAA